MNRGVVLLAPPASPRGRIGILILLLVVIPALVLLWQRRPAPLVDAPQQYSFLEHEKTGALAFCIVGDYFQPAFVAQLTRICEEFSPETRTVLFTTPRYRAALTPLLEGRGVRNTAFFTFEPEAPILREWARDVVLSSGAGGGKVLVVPANKHAVSAEGAGRLIDDLAPLFPPGWTVRRAPFVFESGNIVFVESRGRRVAIVGRKFLFDNETYQRQPWAAGLTRETLMASVRETFGVDSVVVVGLAPSRPRSLLYFEYHVDMGMAVLSGNRAVVSHFEFGERQKGELERAYVAGAPALSALGASRAELSNRLHIVAHEYERYADCLRSLGIEVIRSPTSWRYVASSMSWTNILQLGDRVLVPLYPDTCLGRLERSTLSGGRLVRVLRDDGIRDEEFTLTGLNEKNYRLFETLEMQPVVVPEYLHYFTGGIHCFVNVLE